MMLHPTMCEMFAQIQRSHLLQEKRKSRQILAPLAPQCRRRSNLFAWLCTQVGELLIEAGLWLQGRYGPLAPPSVRTREL